ncbi:MAG: MnhB domain-containing protein [Ignisphaera sp.]
MAAIFRNVKEMFLGEYRGLSTIVKISAKLIVILTAIASISIVVCGHLTPGGGFQGGSTLAAITTLIIVAYSIEAMYRKKITLGKILKLRYSAFAILLLVAITPVAYGLFSQVKTYYLQNSVKEDSWFSMPTSFFGTPLGGSIFFFNLVEYIVVASSIAFIVMLLSMRLRELGLED